ncbi:MAG TPA: phage tail protein [Thermodesulfovibrionales bacterium]|nr:phage tail protein [Thermodesulfovibrionales bacterium]
MPAGQRKDPYRNFRFRVEVDGITQAGFSECTVGDATTDPIEYREGTDSTTVRKLSGLTKYANVTLKWGITDSLDIYNWRKQIIDTGAEGARKNLSIILVDEAGKDKARWNIMQAWPTKYDPPDFTAKGNDVAIETLEIVHEGIQRVS